MKSTIGKVSAIMILLAFILASTFVLNIAIAQNETHVFENVTINDTVDNESASWDFVEGNSSNETVENVTIIPNETSNETSLSNLTNSTEMNITLNESETNYTSNETLDLNVSLNETNLTDETNVTLNETNVTLNDTNVTLNETNVTSNETFENETYVEPVIEPVEPKFDVKVVYPQKITRGEDIKITAELTSDSFARNVYLKWVLPHGMEIVSGNGVEICGDLDVNVSCSSEIDIRTNLSVLGLSEIKVVVNYEK